MLEPKFLLSDGSVLAFSAAPVEWLADVARNDPMTPYISEANEGNSEAFSRMYAGRLVQERR